MAFCFKCGNQLQDGSAFCPKCGTPQQGASNPYQANPARASAPKLSGNSPIIIPSLNGLIKFGATVVAFILMLALPWWAVSAFGYSESFSLYHSDMFDVNAAFGIGKIFAIIAIVFGALALIAPFINFNSILKNNIPVAKYINIGYFVSFALAFILNFIGILIEDYVTVSVGFFFILVFGVAAAVVNLSNVIDNNVPDKKLF